MFRCAIHFFLILMCSLRGTQASLLDFFEPSPRKAESLAEHIVSLPMQPTEIVSEAVTAPLTLVAGEDQEAAVDEYEKYVAQKESSRLAHAAYLGSSLEPWKYRSDEKIELLFENAELTTFIKYMEEKFGVTFVTDDALTPPAAGGKSLLGTKISFRTHAPLTRRQVWDVFVMFLDMNGVSPVPGPTEGVYRLVASKNPQSPTDASHGTLPILSGVDASLIPNNDTLIRYVYFVVNANPDTLIKTVDALRSAASPPVIRVPEVNALIITDRAVNIRTMLQVLQELDQVDGHEGLAVIKLQRADAEQAAKLYEAFARTETPQTMAARMLGSRKASTIEYFERGARVIPEPRTNSLIVLGSRTAIETITEFIRTVVERLDDRAEAPQYIYRLKHQSAEPLAQLLQQSVKFSAESRAGQFGGVRDGNKYLKPISIVPEPVTNTLIITADYEDYAHLHDLIKSIDIEQPQVAIRMFLLSLQITESKGFGAQIRNKIPGVNGLLGNNVNFQTTGLNDVVGAGGVTGGSLVENTNDGGALRLLGNIVTLAAGANIGSTVVQLGSDALGVWGLLNMLETYAKVNIVENPFMVTTNKYPAHFAIGQIRRVVDANIFTTSEQQAFKDLAATLDVKVTPQISGEGFITLDVAFELSQFTDPNPNSSNGNRTEDKLTTSVLVNNNQVLAMGGLLRKEVDEVESRVPVLGALPLVGWLFKNRTRAEISTSILLLIQAEILYPNSHDPAAERITKDQLNDSATMMRDLGPSAGGARDPINRLFFQDREDKMGAFIDRFAAKENVYTKEVVDQRLDVRKRVQELPPCRNPYRRRKQKKNMKSDPATQERLERVRSQAPGGQPAAAPAFAASKQPTATTPEDITSLLQQVPAHEGEVS